ncbi:MAG TPA: class I SAM-dependent methyltransferase [Aliidongia sp.]|nr:class I SAM-dependent methyltransferase [Aliidongia sp.]
MSEALRAFASPLVQAALPLPFTGPRFVLRAEIHPGLGAVDGLACEQSFKPEHDRLAAAGYRTEPALDGRWPQGLVLLTRHKAENLANIARAWTMLEPGGWLLCAGGNEVGAASIERQLRAIAGTVGGTAKHHCRIFWCRAGGELPEPCRAWLEAGEMRRAPKTGFLARPGIFGWDAIDEGSALLAEHFTDRIAGKVADLGAGWGYLSAKLIERCPGIASLDLYEAEKLALDAARANITALSPSQKVGYHWHDVTAGVPGGLSGGYDWIVMNPPFHHGNAADPALGRAFIRSAAKALVIGGKLLMVANRNLPYEAELQEHFRHRHMPVETAAFKLFEARR